ncbi:MAG: DUF3881 family protein [Lachnospiraceae bacterium]|jgi:hypothetical protein|nr:DUF3881 family protein [Lachnospiraceae bacterium]
MHRYLRAIGFSEQTNEEVKQLLIDTIQKADYRGITMSENDDMLAEFGRDYASGLGITVAGVFDEKENFQIDYYFPYLKGEGITTYEDVTVERHAAQDSYAGICDDYRLGISMIFYVTNKIPYVKAMSTGRLPVRGTSLTLSALSVKGSILLPLQKDTWDMDRLKQKSIKRQSLLRDAKNGDEHAIEILTVEDMDLYQEMSRRIYREDLYSLVDTSFMPYGVECDQYTIIGEILAVRTVTNHITEEQIWLLTLQCNDLTFDVAINIIDLFGEPKVGRRFKGVIWLQGRINFPEEI